MEARRFATVVACGVICEHDGKILMVREKRDGVEVWNQPVGRVMPGESLHDAAIREVHEESGVLVELTGLLGVYSWRVDRYSTAVRFCFLARAVGGELGPRDERIAVAAWLAREELAKLEPEFRNPLTKACLDDYFAGRRYPREVVVDLPYA